MTKWLVDHRSISYSYTPARLDERRLGRGGAVPGTDDAVLEVVGVSIGLDVHQLGGKIGVYGGAGGEQMHFDGAGDFQVPLQRLGSVD